MAKTKSPEQVIYDNVFKISDVLGYDTFSYLPAEKVKYPFVFIGESFIEDRKTKSGLFGDITQVVHVYHSYKKRFDVTTMLNQIKRECYLTKQMDNIHVRLRTGNIELMMDDTTEEALLHGILTLEFTFNY